MEVTIESQGFEANEDGIDGYYVSTAGTYLPSLSKCNFRYDFISFPLYRNKVVNNLITRLLSCFSVDDQCTLQNGVGFLVFSSDGATRGTGFRVRLAPSGSSPIYEFSTFHTSEPQGTFSYPLDGVNYHNLDRVSVVLQQSSRSPLQITRLDTEASFDYVAIFTIFPFYTASAIRADGA